MMHLCMPRCNYHRYSACFVAIQLYIYIYSCATFVSELVSFVVIAQD